MHVISDATTHFGAELITTASFFAAAGRWIQLWLYQGNEVIAGSGGQDIYLVQTRVSPNERITATGRRFIHITAPAHNEAGAPESKETAAPAHTPIQLALPIQPLILGVTGNLISDPHELARRFFFNIYLNGHLFLFHLKHPSADIYWDHHGYFQIPLPLNIIGRIMMVD
jgi:hypothetical protein